jgi:hypothetical protein
MPPQNAVEMMPSKSGSETPKNGNLNNNNNKLEELKKIENVEPVATQATIIIPPDGGFGWIVMVRNFNFPCKTILSFFIRFSACKFLLQYCR